MKTSDKTPVVLVHFAESRNGDGRRGGACPHARPPGWTLFLRVSVMILGVALGCSMPGVAVPSYGADGPERGPATVAPREAPGIPLKASPDQLQELFDFIIEKTAQREAFSPVKESEMGFSALSDMREQRSEFLAAKTEAQLYYALVKLSNARRDRHLFVRSVDRGLSVPSVANLAAPILVLPDYSDIKRPAFFIADVGEGLTSPKPGDLIVAVNGRPVAEYVEEFRSWVLHSTLHGLYWNMARYLPRLRRDVPLNLYSERLNLTLERSSGERYDVSLPYRDRRSLRLRIPHSGYPGFTRIMSLRSFRVLLDRGRRTILLRWRRFGRELVQDVIDLMEHAERHRLLDHDLIIDVTFSGGGSNGAYAIQRLVDRPFRTTFGNVRLSDAGKDFIHALGNRRVRANAPDIFGLNLSRSWLRDWARTDAREAIDRGDEYTPPVPFKLAHLPKDSDGILQPAPVHFRGRIAIISGPRGGSHLDQFVSMFADNDLAVIVGMPTGGFSNTWEHSAVLYFWGTWRPVVRFMWSIGHTLRPNGEILEGNPAQPHTYIPLTRANFRTYYQTLLQQAFSAIERQ